ncbi:hypothetical protein ACQX2E_06955 [Corynebacterium diphtheriae]
MPWINGEWRPHRRNSLGIRCDDCKLTFAAGHVPTADQNGERICAVCRRKRKEALYPASSLFDFRP